MKIKTVSEKKKSIFEKEKVDATYFKVKFKKNPRNEFKCLFY